MSVAAWGVGIALLQAILLVGGIVCAAFSYYMVSNGRRNVCAAWTLWVFGVILPQIAIGLGLNLIWELPLIAFALITLIACISASCCKGGSGCGDGSSCCSSDKKKKRHHSSNKGGDSCCDSGCGGCSGGSSCCSSGCGGSSCCDSGCDDDDRHCD